MKPALTKFGAQMSKLTGVRAIMKDINETLRAGKGQELMNLSAGNPLILPEVEQLWRDCTAELLESSEYGEVVCRYGYSKGYTPLIEAVAKDFNKRYGLELTERNILITPGSQTLYFYAANVFGGYTEPPQTPPSQGGTNSDLTPPSQGGTEGILKQIVLPLSPDYTGYGGVSLVPEALFAYKPTLDIDASAHRFKYRPDFSKLSITEQTGCVLFSRPCNPTGNVVTDDEVKKIAALAAQSNVPVLIDSAYAPPFPALNYTEMTPTFGENILHCMSLSKAGLPGERVGIAIGSENLIEALECFQANASLHSSRYGQAIAALAIESGKLAHISETVIRPFYKNKFTVLETTLESAMPDIPWFMHRGEGAIFAWIWLKDLPISDAEFYQQLKKVGVIVVPGNSFFPGLREEWQHKHECFRVSLTGSDEEIKTGMQRFAKVAEEVYRNAAVRS
jgi:valine--pyruvate aminotransferase